MGFFQHASTRRETNSGGARRRGDHWHLRSQSQSGLRGHRESPPSTHRAARPGDDPWTYGVVTLNPVPGAWYGASRSRLTTRTVGMPIEFPCLRTPFSTTAAQAVDGRRATATSRARPDNGTSLLTIRSPRCWAKGIDSMGARSRSGEDFRGRAVSWSRPTRALPPIPIAEL